MDFYKSFLTGLWRRDFASLVFVLSALTCCVVTFYTFDRDFNPGPFEIYTSIVACTALISSIASVFLNGQNAPRKLSRHFYFVGLVAFIFGLILCLYRLDFYSLWLDEEVQSFSTRSWPGWGLATRAAGSQQMPLGYYFTALGWDLIGHTVWDLRFLPAVFMAGSGVLFLRLASLLCENKLIYFAAPFVYLLNPWIIRYGQEGRPYGLIVFSGVLWLNALHDLFAAVDSRRELIRSALVLYTTTAIFLITSPYQPFILCGAFVFVSGIFLFSKAWRARAIALWASVGLGALVVIPLFQFARESSRDFLYGTENLGPWSRPLKELSLAHEYANSLFLGQSYFLALVFLFAPLTLIKSGLRSKGLLWIGLSSCVVFGIFFLVPFSLLINYPIYVRYFLVLYPLGLLVILVYFDSLSGYLEGARDRYFRWGWQLIFLAALVAPCARALPDVYYSKKFDRWNFDSKSIFYFFQQTGLPGDVAYVIPYGDPGIWEQSGFLATDFYYPENFPVRVTSFRRIGLDETAADLIAKDLNTQEPRQVYLTFIDLPEPGATSIQQYCSSQPGVDPYIGDKFLICKVTVREGMAKTLDRFFSGLVPTLAEKQRAYRMLDILIRLAEAENDSRKCLGYLADLRRLSGKNALVQSLVRDNERRCGGLKAQR